jgi:hypothetical protein
MPLTPQPRISTRSTTNHLRLTLHLHPDQPQLPHRLQAPGVLRVSGSLRLRIPADLLGSLDCRIIRMVRGFFDT